MNWHAFTVGLTASLAFAFWIVALFAAIATSEARDDWRSRSRQVYAVLTAVSVIWASVCTAVALGVN